MNKIFIILSTLILISCAKQDGDEVLDDILSEQKSLSQTITQFVDNIILTKPSDEDINQAPIRDLSSQLPSGIKVEKNQAAKPFDKVTTKNRAKLNDDIKILLDDDLDTSPNIIEMRKSLLQEVKTRSVVANKENLAYFCKLSSQLVYYTVNNLIMFNYNDGKNIKPGRRNGKIPDNFGMITIKNSFAYKALKINQEKLDIIKDKLETSLPFDVDLFDDLAEQYQYAYYKNCSGSPKKYIFNYNRIFKYKSSDLL